MNTIAEIQKKIGEAQAAYLMARKKEAPEKTWRPLSDSVHCLLVELSAAIAEGASACPKCEGAIHGIQHEHSSGLSIFEVGCPSCRHHRARGFFPEQAVANWNKGCEAYGNGPETNRDGEALSTPPGWFMKTRPA